MSKTIKIILGVAVIAIIVIILVSTKPENTQSIKIGVILPLTGEAAYIGEDVKVAIELAAQDLAKEGINVEISYEDHAADPKNAVSAANRLIAAGINGIIVSMSSPSAAVAPIAEQNKIIMLTDSSSDSPALLHDYVFKDYVSLRRDCRLIAQKAIDSNYKVAALLPNYESGRECENGLKDTGAGIPVEFFALDSSDMRTQLLKLKENGSDFLIIYGLKANITAILKQTENIQYYPKIGCVSVPVACGTPEILSIGEKALNGAWGTQTKISMNPESDPYEYFSRRFEELKGSKPLADYTFYAYDKIIVLAHALNECKLDPDCANSNLLNLRDYNGVGGRLSFDSDGVGQRESLLVILKDGKFEQLQL